MSEKVLLLENISPIAEKIFYENGFEVESLSRGLPQKDLCKKVKGVSILGIRSKTHISKEVLSNGNSLKAIGAYCIGTDQIDIPACSSKGVAIFNAPYSNTRSVAELAIGEIVFLLRSVSDKNRQMHSSVWEKSSENSLEVRGKNLGIVGYGHIGSQLSDLAERFGMNVSYYDLKEQLSRGNAKKYDNLEELLNWADVVSIHVDGRKENKKFFNKEKFKAMKEKSYFLNMSRGFVVDEEALAEYIDNGKIIGAGIDVFENEPLSNKHPFKSALQNKKNVILTPHIGGNTKEAQESIASFVSNALASFYLHGDTSLSVNFPNLRLNSKNHDTRFSHIHKNIPGVMANINKVISSYGINITGQYLDTKRDLGYVVTNIDGNLSEEIIDELKNVEGTISLRVIQ